MINDYENFINIFIENIRKDVLLETNNNIDIKKPFDENFVKNRHKLIGYYKGVINEIQKISAHREIKHNRN